MRPAGDGAVTETTKSPLWTDTRCNRYGRAIASWALSPGDPPRRGDAVALPESPHPPPTPPVSPPAQPRCQPPPLRQLCHEARCAASDCTEASIWQCTDLPSAWREYYRLYMHYGSDHRPARNAAAAAADDDDDDESDAQRRMRRGDLVALARCAGYAEVSHAMALLPQSWRRTLRADERFSMHTVEEVFAHVGQLTEVRGRRSGDAAISPGARSTETTTAAAEWVIVLPPITPRELRAIVHAAGPVDTNHRARLPGTAHRLSLWPCPVMSHDAPGRGGGGGGDAVWAGVTLRMGRFVPNVARALTRLVRHGSVLILAGNGQGKTTLLRDLAVGVAHTPQHRRVTVIDTSSELGGGGGSGEGEGHDRGARVDTMDRDSAAQENNGASPPHFVSEEADDTNGGAAAAAALPFLGRCRRLCVPTRSAQGAAMLAAVQNYTSEVILVDELATSEEAEAVVSVTQRGVRVVATCHAHSLRALVRNRSLNALVGRVGQCFLSNEERRARGLTRKSVLERENCAPFRFVVQLCSSASAIPSWEAANTGAEEEEEEEEGEGEKKYSRSRYGGRAGNGRGGGAVIYGNVNRAVDLLLQSEATDGCAAAASHSVPQTTTTTPPHRSHRCSWDDSRRDANRRRGHGEAEGGGRVGMTSRGGAAICAETAVVVEDLSEELAPHKLRTLLDMSPDY